ncbi:MAG: Ig-like domain-containing protein [Blastocatellales bacterium]
METALPGRKTKKRFDEPDAANKYYLFKRLPEGEKELPIEKYFEAQEEMRLMPQYSTTLDRQWASGAEMAAEPDQQKLGVWTPLGPGNIGGRTRAILINPQDPNVIYSAGVAGGVWKSTNAGATWTPVSDLIANIAVVSLAFDPKNFNVIFAGTGEGFFNGDAVRGAGIFKSADAGQTWTQLTGTAGSSDFHYINDLVVSPNDSMRIYAATRTGVFRTTDGGATWSRALPVSVPAGCTDLAIRTDKQTDFIFAACGSFAQATVYRNADAGAAGAWDSVLSDQGMGRTVIEIAPSNQNVVYALSSAFAGTFTHGLHAFFRSTSSGDSGSWTPRVRNTDVTNVVGRAILSIPPSALSTACKFGTTDSFAGQSWYDLTMAVDPLDENRVWIGSVDLFRTDDGGATWGLGGVVYPPAGEWNIHPDQHFIVFHPKFNGADNQVMYVGNDGGIYRTNNARAAVAVGVPAVCDPNASQVQWTPLNSDYGVTQFYHGAVAPDGKSYFGGTQDNGTVRGEDTTGANNWKMIHGADGGYSNIDFLNPNILYASSQNTNFWKSTDNGQSFSFARFGVTEAGLFITPLIIDPSDPNRLYTGSRSIFRTSDGATTWTNATGRWVSAGTLSAIAIAPTDANTGFFGYSDGTIVRTRRLLNYPVGTLAAAPNEAITRLRAGVVSWVAVDPTNRDIAYAAYSTFGGAHVYRTIDGGVTWASIDGSAPMRIPDIPVHCIAIDPSNTARLYVGTDLGVFVSTDGGATWSVENTGFANVVTESLSVNVANGVTTLFAFTHGRGAFKVTANLSGCNYALSSTGGDFARAGGDVVVNVTTNPGNGCNWIAQSNAPWITVASSAGGVGNGSVALKVLANNSIGSRAGTVHIAGRSFTVIQEGAPDIDAPSLAITNPATPVINTAAGSINILGTASDNIRVASVTWFSNRGLAGTATGAAAWGFALPLVTGQNVVTINARDDAGNISSAATVTVNTTASSVLVTSAGTGVTGFSGDGGQSVAATFSGPLRPTFDSAGNLYICDFNNNRIRKIAPNGVITTIVGNGSRGFSGDGGQAVAAQINQPVSIAIDKDGNIYFADRGNERVRKVTVSTGVITTVAGKGTAGFSGDNGSAADAQLSSPNAVAVDAAGNLYIADSSNNRIRKVTANTQVITTIAGTGTAGFSGDNGAATSATLRGPFDAKLDSAGDIYISDNGNNRIRKITASSGVINTIAGTGSTVFNGDNIPATNAALGNVLGMALDSAKNIFLSDVTNFRIRRIAADTGVIATIAGGGGSGFSPDGSAAVGARLNNVQGLAVDPMGAVYFSETNSVRIRRIVSGVANDTTAPVVQITSPVSAAAYTSTNNPLELKGTASDNGAIAAVRWSNDRGGSGAALGTNSWTIPVISLANGVNNITVTAWDVAGNANSAGIAVTFNAQQLLVTVAGTGVNAQSRDGGPGVAATLSLPMGIVADKQGNVIFADSTNRRVRKVSPAGVISAFAGTGILGSSGDGGSAVDATMNLPRGLAIDSAGNVYIADTNLNKVRKVGVDGKITTVAGKGSGFGDFSGDNGPATKADLAGPEGVAVDSAGNIYIADRNNMRVRKVAAATGVITTIAGTGLIGFSGDNAAATQADLFAPSGVAVDAGGNVYIADVGNQRIRRINAADGKITTIAGTGSAGYNGDGIQAKDAQLNLTTPCLISLDPAGDLIVPDNNNGRIRKITMSTGVISTIAGGGVAGAGSEAVAPAGAVLSGPTAAFVDAAGNLFISDTLNNRVRRTVTASALRTVAAISAASFATPGELASDSVAAAFGADLASASQSANSLPLPLALSGTTVKVRDTLGAERLAQLFMVASGQINFAVPSGTASGLAAITVTNDKGEIATGSVSIAAVAPGLFAANANGQGVAAAVVLRIKPDNTVQYEPVARFDSATARFVPAPIDLGPESDKVFLVAFATGVRGRSALANVRATVGGVNAPVIFAGSSPGFIGLDQSNIQLDRSLIGKGEVDLILTVDGKVANAVKINIK